MSEMEERVRAAIDAQLEVHGAWVSQVAIDDLARAAITAMREPTEEMWRAGSDSIDGYQRLKRAHAYAIEAQATWRAMIDAALAPREALDD